MPRLFLTVLFLLCASFVFGEDQPKQKTSQEPLSFQELKESGAQQSTYLRDRKQATPEAKPEADLATYRKKIEPLLRKACYDCHGAETQERDLRLDTLNPDLIRGQDTAWWLEVFQVLSNGEMPPEGDAELAPKERSAIVDWLSRELQVASLVRRSEGSHSSFRRMTSYEYNYALQDLLGLPFDFAADLPPETPSEDGFLNSSDMLQMSASQLATYRELARNALRKATVRGSQPDPVYYAIKMGGELEKDRARFQAEIAKLKERFADDPERLEKELAKRKRKRPGGAHYRDLETGATAAARWSYGGARYAHKPVPNKPEAPAILPQVAVLPVNQRLIVDLGDHLPDRGNMRIRLRASAVTENEVWVPSLRIYFGHQASNNSRADERVGNVDLVLDNASPEPKFYEFDVPLSEVVRNPFRGIQKLGQTPNPAEYVMLQNTSGTPVNIQIDYIEIIAPHFEQWPPESHRRVLPARESTEKDAAYARRVLDAMITRAWRRPPTSEELDRKLALLDKLRPHCEDEQEALLEVLAGVLASPNFLYLVQTNQQENDLELATRLSMFLWSSLPDAELLSLAQEAQLSKQEVLTQQIDRMMNDSRSNRFASHFVRQWLGMELIDHLKLDSDLKAAMHEEPIAFFREVLRENSSVLDFLHADYTMANATLARHYGIQNVYGHQFQRVALSPEHRRGGILTQAGLLAMNSDGKDSHPLKRGIWLLESILNDPPPPPPPAVPEIDLTDPNILKLTLKERMEDHRNDPACMSCHQRIDPWGIAFENFDAMGRWRTTVGKKPVDANSVLFNKQELRGVDGLKRFLLSNRQDQFARALTHKLCVYALGRPLSFADRAEVDRITAELRRQGDGLQTLVKLIISSELFQPTEHHLSK